MGIFKEDDFEKELPLSVDILERFGPVETEPHWHNYLQIGLCTDGEIAFSFTNKEYLIKKNDIFIVNNFEHHSATRPQNKYARFILVIFKPELIASPGSPRFDFEYLEPFRYNIKNFKNRIEANCPQAEQIRSLIKDMLEIFQKKDVGYRHLLAAMLREILALLVIHYKSTYANYSYGLNITPEALMILKEVELNYTKNLSMKDLAAKYHMSESRLRGIFHDYIQMGFKEYINYLRLNDARKLLLTTNDSIVDIALATGYSNINQFYKVFKTYVEMSPAEYRQRFKDLNR